MEKLNNAQSIHKTISVLHEHGAKTYDCAGGEALQHAAGYANAFMDMEQDMPDQEAIKIFRMIADHSVLKPDKQTKEN